MNDDDDDDDDDGDVDGDVDDDGDGDKFIMMKCVSQKMSTARCVCLVSFKIGQKSATILFNVFQMPLDFNQTF